MDEAGDHDHDDLAAQFMAITDAPRHVAEGYLSAHNWALEPAIAFFFEHPPEEAPVAVGVQSQPIEVRSAARSPGAHGDIH